MATQIATTDDTARAPKVPVKSGGHLAAFVPQSLEEAWRLSGAIAASGMTPKTYGTDQNKVMVGIMAGAELGLTPFAALQSIAVINGTPSLWGDGMLGLVEASGLLEDFEETDDGKTATCRAVRKGRATPIVRTFSVEDAKAAGLAGKAGPWQQYPKRMRQLRARSFCLRDGFSDVLKGVKSAEEVRDYAPMDGGLLQTQTVTAALIEQQASAEPEDHREGRDDTQMGEGFTEVDPATGELFESPAATRIAEIRAKIDTAADIDVLGAVMSENRSHMAAMSEDVTADLWNAHARRKASFTQGGGK